MSLSEQFDAEAEIEILVEETEGFVDEIGEALESFGISPDAKPSDSAAEIRQLLSRIANRMDDLDRLAVEFDLVGGAVE